MVDLLASLTPGTRAKYGLDLSQLHDWLAPQGLSLDDVSPSLFVRYAESKGWAPSTVRGVVSALRWYFHASGQDGHPFLAFKARRIDPLPGRVLSAAEFRAVIKGCPTKRKVGARDLALFWVLGETGVRASELCALRLSDLDLDRSRLRVLAKGSRQQYKQLSAECVAILEAWIDARKIIAKPNCATVFCSVDHGQPLTRHGLGVVCRRAARRAGIEDFSPHALRRFMAAEASRNGTALPVLMQQGGWSNYQSFSRYVLSLSPADFAGHSPVVAVMGGRA